MDLNRVNDENTKLKTKHAILKDQIKNKDKFIDELLKSTYVMSQAMGMGGFGSLKKTLIELRRSKRGSKLKKNQDDESGDKKENLKAEQMNNAAHNYFQQNFLEKGPYNLLKLKKQVNELKEMLSNKNEEIFDLKRNIKSTRITELNEEM